MPLIPASEMVLIQLAWTWFVFEVVGRERIQSLLIRSLLLMPEGPPILEASGFYGQAALQLSGAYTKSGG